ncbi:MAG: protein kinase domain-containing protein [Candidatus Sumerlaeia bacterium]
MRRSRFFLFLLYFGLISCFFALGFFAPAQNQVSGSILWSKAFGFSNPLEALCSDFNLDGSLELFLSDRSGSVMLVNAATGSVLWRKDLEGSKILEPLSGQFLHYPGPPEIAILHQDGRLHILAAGSGEILANAMPDEGRDFSFLLPPSLVPEAGEGGKDLILAIDTFRRFRKLVVGEKNTLIDLWENAPAGELSSLPPAVPSIARFRIRPDEKPVWGAVFPNQNRELLFLNIEDSNRPATPGSIRLGQGAQVHIAIEQNREAIAKKIYLIDALGNIRDFELKTEQGVTRLKPTDAEIARLGVSPRQGLAPLLLDINKDQQDDIVLFSDSRVVSVDGKSREIIGQDTVVSRYVVPPALFQILSGQPILLTGDEAGFLYVDDPRFDDPNEILMNTLRLPRLAQTTPLVFDSDGDRWAEFFIQEYGQVSLILSDFMIEQGKLIWPAARGSKLRCGGRSFYLEDLLSRRRENQELFLSNALENARISLNNKDFQDALIAAEDALLYNSRLQEARDIRSQALLGRHLYTLIYVGASVLILLFVLILFLLRWLRVRSFLKKSRQLADGGYHEALQELCDKYFKKNKGPASTIETMAELCMKCGIVPVKEQAVLERKHERDPSDINVLLLLARIYLARDKYDAQAEAIYKEARKKAPEYYAFERALGRIALEQGRLDEARDRLEKAKDLGDTSTELFNDLARVNYQKKLFGPKYIDVYRHGARNMPEETWALEALARSYILAGLQQDSRAQKTFDRLLELDPKSPLANQEIAAREYRAGRLDSATQAARLALEGDPENPTALHVLAWCLWRKGDQSPEARDIYYRAELCHPHDSELIKIVSLFLLEQERCEDFPEDYARARKLLGDSEHIGQDADSRAALNETAPHLIIRAILSHQSDQEFLRKTADAGLRWSRDEIAQPALENIRDQERTDADIIALTHIYIRQNSRQPRNLPILYRAFLIDPTLPGLAELIAEIVIENQISDPQCLEALCYLMGTEPLEADGKLSDSTAEAIGKRASDATAPRNRIRYGLHLAKVYRDQEHFSAMAEMLHKVGSELDALSENSQASGDADLQEKIQNWRTEMQRLLAVAHSNLKHFDEAVDHYKALLESNPQDPDAILGLGRTYARMDHRDQEMRDAIFKARELAPEDPLLNFACGRINANAKNWNGAARDFSNALKANKDHAQAIQDFLQLLIRRNKGEKSVPIRWLRVQMLLYLRDYEEVLAETERIFAINTEEADRIQSVFERILANEPDNAPSLFGKARMLFRQEEYAQARRILEDLVHSQDKRAYKPAKILLANVYEASLAQEPNTDLRFKLGSLYLELEDYDKAVNCFQKTRNERGLEEASTRNLAICFFHKNMLELALQEFQNVPVDENVVELLYQLAQKLESQGNVVAARSAYQRIYGFNAGYKDVADRLNQLSQASDNATSTLQATVNLSGDSKDKSQPKQRFDLRRQLGKGAMATVFEAYDRELEETVALKILPENFLDNPEALRRFRQEARSARKLAHPNIVRIHDIGEEHGKKFISMEFIDGLTLRQILHSDKFELHLPSILHYCKQISLAIAYAHENGIIHRDLKPANVMIARDEQGGVEMGTVKIADFGIAKVAESQHQTITGAVVGTPLYMSPEQVLGKGCDHRADLYSFGVMLYEMLSGKPPFKEGDLAYHHLHTAPEPLKDVHPGLGAIAMRCLEKDAENRYRGFPEILEELDKIEAEST